jgi:hemoglobin
MNKDIETIEDVSLFVSKFYDKLLADDSINQHFKELDIKSHLQVIVDFWSTILLGTQIYKNNTIQAHKHLQLKKEDFGIWINHFNATLDELFEGDKTDEAKSRAKTIGLTMRYKLLGE